MKKKTRLFITEAEYWTFLRYNAMWEKAENAKEFVSSRINPELTTQTEKRLNDNAIQQISIKI